MNWVEKHPAFGEYGIEKVLWHNSQWGITILRNDNGEIQTGVFCGKKDAPWWGYQVLKPCEGLPNELKNIPKNVLNKLSYYEKIKRLFYFSL